MAYNTDNHTRGTTDPRPPHDPHLHIHRVPPQRGNSMAFIVGGVVVAVIVLFLLFSGTFRTGEPVTTSPAAVDGAPPAAVEGQPAAPVTGDGMAPATDDGAPAPDAAPAAPAPADTAPAEPAPVPAPAD
ncbi:MAG: hypothetical protein JJU19_01725 [Pararhodobacter sp.]|nr:hypothetical protein [Pararhodobacter sp.]